MDKIEWNKVADSDKIAIDMWTVFEIDEDEGMKKV